MSGPVLRALLFFFSSRRRHTRYWRDWSSDVCSSDLWPIVVIDVDRPVKDDEYPTADYGYQRVYFGPGPQLMDGAHALEYARSRHGTNDFSRAGRQQRVIVSVRNRVLQLNMLSRAPELIGIVQSSLATDLTPVQMLA